MTPGALNILLVEDNPADARSVMRAFAKISPEVRVYHAQDGLEALAAIRRDGRFRELPLVDLVLLDVKLPGADGFEVLAELRRNILSRRIPVIILSALEDEKDIVRAYEGGANCFVTKPIDPAVFERCLQAIVDFWGVHVQYRTRRTSM